MKIQEVKSHSRTQRVYAHTHLEALGLDADGSAQPIAAGFAGQEAAREVNNRIFFIALIIHTRVGRRTCSRLDQIQKDGWPGVASSWGSWYRKDGHRIGDFKRAGPKSTLLPHGRK